MSSPVSLHAPASPRESAPLAAHALPVDRDAARRHGWGFWLIAGAFLTAMAFSTVPTPLYPLYQARVGFSTFMVTIVFAVYALGVLMSLLLAGHVSDWIGRKTVLIAGLVLELAAAALFLLEPSLVVLLLARLVTGLGVGLLTATATAYLHELHKVHRPGDSPQRFEIVSTAANIGGVGIGPLVAGVLAQYVQAPLRLPYLFFGGLLLLSILAVALTPETAQRPADSPAYRPQRISTDHGDPAAYVAALAAGFASFAVFGLFTSLAPGFVSGSLHQTSKAVAGLVVFAVFGSAALAQILTTRISLRARRILGLSTQAAGAGVLALGMQAANLPVFLLGGITAGIGAGVLFKAAVGAVAAQARPEKRSGALAGLFLFSYLGLAVPAVGLGIATQYTAATTAMTGFTAMLLVLLGAVAMLARRSRTSC